MSNQLTFTENLLLRAPMIHGALMLEPLIVPDLSNADTQTILVVMYCAMWGGVTDPDMLHAYLERRGCKLPRQVYQFLLDLFEGTDDRQHLWMRDKFSNYVPRFTAMPEPDASSPRPAGNRPMASRALSPQT